MDKNMNLESLAKMFLQSQPKQADSGPKFITAGNKVMGMDDTTQSPLDRLVGSLSNMASSYLYMMKMKRQKELMESVKNVMGSDLGVEDTTDDKGGVVSGKKSKLLEILLSQDELPKPLINVRDVLLKDIGGKGQWKAKVVNGKLIRYNPTTGKTNVLYQGDNAQKGLLGDTPASSPEPVGKLNPLRVLPGYAYYDKKPLKPQDYAVGGVYKDAKGRKAKYLGSGKWELQ